MHDLFNKSIVLSLFIWYVYYLVSFAYEMKEYNKRLTERRLVSNLTHRFIYISNKNKRETYIFFPSQSLTYVN